MPKVFHQLSQLSNYRAKPHPPNVLYHSHKIDLLLIHFEKTIERNQKCQMKHTHIDHWFNRKNMSNFHFSNCLIFCVVRNIWLTMEQFPFFLNLFIYLFIYWVILFIYLFIYWERFFKKKIQTNENFSFYQHHDHKNFWRQRSLHFSHIFRWYLRLICKVYQVSLSNHKKTKSKCQHNVKIMSSINVN